MDSLNAFRAVLVALAALAMLVSLALGLWRAALWMAIGISLHSALWVYLWRQKRDEAQALDELRPTVL